MPLPVSLPVAVPVWAVSVLTGSPILNLASAPVSAAVIVGAIRIACAGILLGLLSLGKTFCNELVIKLLCTLFAVLHCQA